jgi:hypothetical protein
MIELLWMVPFAAFMLFALWRFISGVGPREISEADEQNAVDLALGKPPQDPLWTGRLPDDPNGPVDRDPR